MDLYHYEMMTSQIIEEFYIFIKESKQSEFIPIEKVFEIMSSFPNSELESLRTLHQKLFELSRIGFNKVEIQKEMFHELAKAFSKFSQKLTEISKKIKEQITKSFTSNIELRKDADEDSSTSFHYEFLSNSLTKLADCAKKISSNQRQEVSEPIKFFLSNYKETSDILLNRIVDSISKISESQLELNKSRNQYYSISQKLSKEREIQSRIISKIENGEKNELEKFNTQIKKLNDLISASEIHYKETISKANEHWEVTKKIIYEAIASYENNEETRITFSKRLVLSTLKLLENLEKGVTKDFEANLSQSEQLQIKMSSQASIKVGELANEIKSINLVQTFVSHEDYLKKQKKSEANEQSHLQEIFKKVRSEDKEKIKEFIESWFNTLEENSESEEARQTETVITVLSKEEHNVKSKRSIRLMEGDEEKLENIKGRIIEALPYSFYFIEEFYNQVFNMTSYYCKLTDEKFYFLLNTFNVFIKSVDLESINEVIAEFIYKMMFISQRVSWKKSQSQKNQSIELLSSHFSKDKTFFNKKILSAIYQYLCKKKIQTKKSSESTKNALTSFTKNIFSRKREKEVILSAEDQFTCLSEMTNLIANFNVDKELSLTFIKDVLAESDPKNMVTFEYLKAIILSIKDIEERRKIFFKTEVKAKREQNLRKIIHEKKIPEHCIKITAERGFFSKKEVSLRLISKNFITIHHEILIHLQIETHEKWIHLIPYDKSLQYIEMKEEVADKSVPSATEEIITLDVNRSLHIHGERLTPTVLHTLLRVYAFYHKDISYCQGMNYIAGYLYIKTLKEEEAYRIFEYIMEIRFKELFANEFEVLKIKMYQFNRLLAIFHPEISDHFIKQAISSECYIVPWIITLFASSYQYTMQSYLIDTLWERFILYGWKEFFRFILWIFDLKKEELIELTYDKALHYLGEFAKSKFLLASTKEYQHEFKHIEKVENGMDRFEITSELLESLSSEYKLSK